MSADESSHARLLAQMTQFGPGGVEGGVLPNKGRHRATGGNALRAAVLGANDGLVSNLSLVMGVAGAALDNQSILITGLAGMLAGAISMALGEWLSVQSSRELYAHQIEIETEEIIQSPEEETEELALIYEARGLPKEQALNLAEQIIANRESAVETLAREELGMDPKELGGSAWEAAITSFVLFSVGAVIPVIGFAVFKWSSGSICKYCFGVLLVYLYWVRLLLCLQAAARFLVVDGWFCLAAGSSRNLCIGHLVGVSLGG
jgi:VIT1/CCC1 family predicted Fe2+/Mn2+ transporter